ncbi:MAG: hypothetical protein LQ342_006111 [Letrouitia transgressa]|nr:MAG: hypothetical protein LQ342_006111 [Letrouitia transgressa]
MACRNLRNLEPANDTSFYGKNGHNYLSSDQRWSAVQSRDIEANHAFLYGVTTTSVYCRPTCPGRVARRSNVVFFESISMAKQSGYRPCKRCKPDLVTWNPNTHGQKIVADAQRLMREMTSRGEKWIVEDVAKQLGIGGAHLHRMFKRYLGETPKSSSLQAEGINTLGSVGSAQTTNAKLADPEVDDVLQALDLAGIDWLSMQSSVLPSSHTIDYMHDLDTVTTDSLEQFELLTNFQTIDEFESMEWDKILTSWPVTDCHLQSDGVALGCRQP